LFLYNNLDLQGDRFGAGI